MEEAAAGAQRQLAGHVEELQRQLEAASHEVDEWRQQASEANEHAQQLQRQLQEGTSRAAQAEVCPGPHPAVTRRVDSANVAPELTEAIHVTGQDIGS